MNRNGGSIALGLAVGGLAIGGLLATPGMAAADTYTQATFSGQINPGDANVQPPFSGAGFTQGDTFSGSFVFDNNLVPAAGTGFVNVFGSSFPDIGGISNTDLFSITLDSLSFNAGDNLTSDLSSTGIQYNNGQFNGLEFITDFTFAGHSYQFQIDGPVITVLPVDASGNPTSFNSLINATINTGNGSLSNLTPFTPTSPPPPPVPEPAAWAMMLMGFAGLGAAMRARRRTAFAAG